MSEMETRIPTLRPQEPGWYYAMPCFCWESGTDQPWPHYVTRAANDRLYSQKRNLSYFEWFGPIPSIKAVTGDAPNPPTERDKRRAAEPSFTGDQTPAQKKMEAGGDLASDILADELQKHGFHSMADEYLLQGISFEEHFAWKVALAAVRRALLQAEGGSND